MKTIYNYIWWVWELPQLLAAFLVLTFVRPLAKYKYQDAIVVVHGRKFNVALSRLILVNKPTTSKLQHEYGHVTQSKYLGPLYLLVIGIPSLLHCVFHQCRNYYHFYTEKWANKLHKDKQK